MFDNISILDCQKFWNSKNGAAAPFLFQKLHISTETGLLLLLKNLSAYDHYIDWDLTQHVLPCTL
jgi:hypothetical protein